MDATPTVPSLPIENAMPGAFDPFQLSHEQEDENALACGYRASDYSWFGYDVPEFIVSKCQMCDAVERYPRADIIKMQVMPQVCKDCKRRALKIYDDSFWAQYLALRLWQHDLFADQFDEFHTAHTGVDGVRHIHPIRSADMKGQLALMLNTRTKIDQAIMFMEGLARKAGTVRKLELRVAKYDGAIWIDLCDDKWRAVRLDEYGWQVVEHPAILFRRYRHMLPLQIDPSGTKADLDAFLDLFNFQTENDRMLHTGFLVGEANPEGDCAIAVIAGPQGAAKTTTAIATRMVFDPSTLPTLNMSKEPDELPQKILHHRIPTFDNCNYITQETSDLLCQASSGMGFSKRKLFTDGEDVSYSVRRPLILDGVGVPSMAPDFLDRATITHLDRITPETRRERREIEAVRDALLPKVRGYILNTISAALKVAKDAPPEKVALPRLAEYAKMADDCLTQMGYPKGKFLATYIEANADVAQQAVQADPLASVLLEFLEVQPEWEGTANELLRLLEARAGSATKAPGWPKTHNWLSEALTGRLKPGLKMLGWQVEKKRSGTRRTLHISKVIDSLRGWGQ